MESHSCVIGKRRLPQWAETFGFFLPRPILNWAEIHGWPDLVSQGQVDACISFWRSRKVALVKQTAYWALYDPVTPSGTWQETVLGNTGHLGPMALLADLGADYFVVRQEKDPECFLWRQKYVHCPDPEARFQDRLREIEAWDNTPSGKRAVRCGDVPWSDYDLVVCMDIPVPDRIVQNCRKTCWAYFSTEPGSPLQKEALKRPRAGYRLFLNHGFRRYRCRPRINPGVLEFPYSFQSSYSWKGLIRHVMPQPSEKRGILVEGGSWQDPMPPVSLPCTKLQGGIRPYLKKMATHRYAIRTNPKMRWGNWAIEAVLAGNLFLGKASSLDHRSALLPTLDCPDLPAAFRRVEAIEKSGHWPGWLACQRDMVEHLSFRRPLMELTLQAKNFFAHET